MNIHVAISNWLSGEKIVPEVGFDQLYAAIEAVFGINKEMLTKRGRKPDIVEARHAFCYVAKQYIGKSFGTIAKEFGQDHTTVIHAVQTFQNRLDTNYNGAEQKLSRLKSVLNLTTK